MKKWQKWTLGGVLVLLLCWGWFSRPMGLEQMFPGLSPEQMEAVTGYYFRVGISQGFTQTSTGNLSEPIPLDEEALALVEELFSARFSRSLPRTVQDRVGNSYSPMRDTPLDYSMLLCFSGEENSLWLDLYHDRLILTYFPRRYESTETVRWVCSSKGQEELMDGFLAYLEAHAATQ